MNKGIGSFIKTTLLDFPGRVSCTVFLKGCNLYCPYCYNLNLVKPELMLNSPDIPLEEVFEHLERRKNVLTGITVSGGEALLNPLCKKIIIKAHELNYLVKLDTNGTVPSKLEELLKSRETSPDYIAMDLKTDPENYSLLLPSATQKKLTPEQKEITNKTLYSNLKKSVDLISSFPADKREWRTVLVPSLVDESSIKKIASFLPADSRLFLSEFQNGSCINPDFNSISPFTKENTEKLLQAAKNILPGTELR